MEKQEFLDECRKALKEAGEEGTKLATFHLIVLKNAEMLNNMSAAEFCAAVDVRPGFAAEFTQMKALHRLMQERNVWLVQA